MLAPGPQPRATPSASMGWVTAWAGRLRGGGSTGSVGRVLGVAFIASQAGMERGRMPGGLRRALQVA